MEKNRSKYRIAKMAEWLQVSKSGYYAWRKRYPSIRELENQELLDEIRRIHQESNRIYGSIKITREINENSDKPVNHKRVERIMQENGIASKTKKKYKATTNSNHNLPVAENILNRDFKASEPGQKMVSDITYIPTEEGWLYLAGVMDLCGQKIVGIL
jgi:putative transposase